MFLAEPRTNVEVEAYLAARFPAVTEPRIWWALRTYAPLIHAPGPHPWTYGQRPSYLAAPSPGYDGEPLERHGCCWPGATCGVRSGDGRRPRPVHDLARAPASAAVAALRGSEELVGHTGPDGKALVDLVTLELAEPEIEAPPRLLGMWDNMLLSHADRSRLIPPDYRATVIRRNGDVLPMVLVDGYVAGMWRPIAGRHRGDGFPPAAQGGRGTVWRSRPPTLRQLLADRDPLVFSRYGHWWKTVEGAETKLL